MFTLPYGRDVVRLRAGRRYNPRTELEDLLDWSDDAVTRLTISGSIIAPVSQTEPMETDDDRTVAIMAFYGPYDADVRNQDRLEDPGILDDDGEPIVWQVSGDADAGRWMNPFTGEQFGCEIPVVGVI